MKKLLLVLAVAIASCNTQKTQYIIEPRPILVNGHIQAIERFEIIDIDGCEYIVNHRDYEGIIHKGNCKNPIHLKTK